jgi:hypothetical protein
MPAVFVSLARHSLEEFNSPHAHKAPDPRILGGPFPVILARMIPCINVITFLFDVSSITAFE